MAQGPDFTNGTFLLQSSSFFDSVMLSRKVFCGMRVLRSQLRKWDREKEGGRQEELGREESGMVGENESGSIRLF